MERYRHWQGLLIIIALIALGSLYLWQNSGPSVRVAVPAATPTPDDRPADWQVALEAQIAAAGTPLPTPELDASPYVPPTLPPSPTPGEVVIAPGAVEVTPWPTPTMPTAQPLPNPSGGPTAFPSPTGLAPPAAAQDIGFQPPPEQVPLSSHANDHFWLVRPVDASANSESLFFYPFGSNGPTDEWRVHHGVDMPNPIGERIRAGGAGTVVFAGDGGEIVDRDRLDIYPSYGNVVIIRHDFGYRGQPIYTLYAHMSSILVEAGQHVEAGQVIGLIGGTGDVSGPHVHLEVRVGENKYFAVQNPLLWIAPYQGHGVIAGLIFGENGEPIDDRLVTLSQRGRVIQTTTTYINPKTDPDQLRDWEVVPDRAWNENFVIGDVPAGDYVIAVTIGSRRISREITVKPGTINYIELGLGPAATPQPVETGAADTADATATP